MSLNYIKNFYEGCVSRPQLTLFHLPDFSVASDQQQRRVFSQTGWGGVRRALGSPSWTGGSVPEAADSTWMEIFHLKGFCFRLQSSELLHF